MLTVLATGLLMLLSPLYLIWLIILDLSNITNFTRLLLFVGFLITGQWLALHFSTMLELYASNLPSMIMLIASVIMSVKLLTFE